VAPSIPTKVVRSDLILMDQKKLIQISQTMIFSSLKCPIRRIHLEEEMAEALVASAEAALAEAATLVVVASFEMIMR